MINTVVTVTGIRPDFIRMSHVFKELDSNENINHILIHTGQHYDKMLSDVFFEELNIRKPDYNLEIGGAGKKHYHQVAELTVKLTDLLNSFESVDTVLFLGDSNSVMVAPSLKKEGYTIGHIEAGMRSYDERMLEETNRKVCDHSSDLLFVYHENYRQNLLREGITKSIDVVGNTIVEPLEEIVFEMNLFSEERKMNYILADIHRPENFLYEERMQCIFDTLSLYSGMVKFLKFPRTMEAIQKFKIKVPKNIEFVDLMSFKQYVRAQYHSYAVFSDSGTAQEETALLGVPVIVPRQFTERKESVLNNCSFMLNFYESYLVDDMFRWIEFVNRGIITPNTDWLRINDGIYTSTSKKIVNTLI